MGLCSAQIWIFTPVWPGTSLDAGSFVSLFHASLEFSVCACLPEPISTSLLEEVAPKDEADFSPHARLLHGWEHLRSQVTSSSLTAWHRQGQSRFPCPSNDSNRYTLGPCLEFLAPWIKPTNQFLVLFTQKSGIATHLAGVRWGGMVARGNSHQPARLGGFGSGLEVSKRLAYWLELRWDLACGLWSAGD